MSVLSKLKRAVRGEVKPTTAALEVLRRTRVSFSRQKEERSLRSWPIARHDCSIDSRTWMVNNYWRTFATGQRQTSFQVFEIQQQRRLNNCDFRKKHLSLSSRPSEFAMSIAGRCLGLEKNILVKRFNGVAIRFLAM